MTKLTVRHPTWRVSPHLDSVNNRTKEICLKGLSRREVIDKIQLLLDSSGAKIKPIKGHPVHSTSPSVRGVWSGMHVEEPFKI